MRKNYALLAGKSDRWSIGGSKLGQMQTILDHNFAFTNPPKGNPSSGQKGAKQKQPDLLDWVEVRKPPNCQQLGELQQQQAQITRPDACFREIVFHANAMEENSAALQSPNGCINNADWLLAISRHPPFIYPTRF